MILRGQAAWHRLPERTHADPPQISDRVSPSWRTETGDSQTAWTAGTESPVPRGQPRPSQGEVFASNDPWIATGRPDGVSACFPLIALVRSTEQSECRTAESDCG